MARSKSGLRAALPFILWGMSFFMMTFGLVEYFVHVDNRKVTVLSMQEFIKNKPKKKWVRITGGVLGVPEGLYYDRDDGPFGLSRIFVPVYPADSEDPRIRLYVVIRDRQTIDLFTPLLKLEENEADALIEASPDLYYPQRTVEGLLNHWVGSSEGRAMRKTVGNTVARDVAMLSEGSRPSATLAYALLFLGTSVGGAGVALWFTRKGGRYSASKRRGRSKRGDGPRDRSPKRKRRSRRLG